MLRSSTGTRLRRGTCSWFRERMSQTLGAVAAVTDLFDGQPQGTPEYAVIKLDGAWYRVTLEERG